MGIKIYDIIGDYKVPTGFADHSSGWRVKRVFQEEMMSPVRQNKSPQAGKGHFLSKQIKRLSKSQFKG
jgi:hypothetical protein